MKLKVLVPRHGIAPNHKEAMGVLQEVGRRGHLWSWISSDGGVASSQVEPFAADTVAARTRSEAVF